jgi:regulator of replication initiation timing
MSASSNQRIRELTRKELEKEVKRLRLENKELKERLQQAQNARWSVLRAPRSLSLPHLDISFLSFVHM